MPRAPILHAVTRQWEILKRLPKRPPGITVAELCGFLRGERELQVSVRTVERDLKALERVFPLSCADTKMPHRWSLLPSSATEFGGLDLAEALTLSLAEDSVRRVLPPSLLPSCGARFEGARAKLTSAASHPFAKLAKRFRSVPATLQTIAPGIDARVYQAVQNALTGDQQLQVAYLGHGYRRPRQRTLHPLGLVLRAGVFYLVAKDDQHEDVRLNAVHRIMRAEVLNAPCCPPENFDLDRYLGDGGLLFGNGKKLTFRASLDEHLAMLLTESPLSEDQRIHSTSRSHELVATVADSWQLRWWILSQGTAIEVLAPKALRSEIAKTLVAAVAPYRRVEGKAVRRGTKRLHRTAEVG